ncbi:hypothetical protein Tco_0353375 [Tanacetum coccineum]
MILGELHRLNDLELNYSACGCQLREVIPLNSVDIFWRTLDVSWSTPLEHEDIQCDDELHIFKETFNKQSNAGKKSLLRRLVVISLANGGNVEGCTTTFPLWSSPPQSEPHETIVIAHVYGNHYIKAALREGCPLPITHPLWRTYRSDIVSRWEVPYVSRQ